MNCLLFFYILYENVRVGCFVAQAGWTVHVALPVDSTQLDF